MNITDSQIDTQISHLSKVLLINNWHLCVAESCTGGWLSKCCTDIVGSSRWFDRGFITYSNQAKQDMLNVNAATIKQFGAVSEQVVIEMAQGALRYSSADISVAITGIAGPDGGSVDKPVGTVWIAWATSSSTKAKLHHFSGSRDAIRRQAVYEALCGIIKNASD